LPIFGATVALKMFSFATLFQRSVKMLVLSRKVDEVICIGDDIEIQVVRIGNGTVRLGIRAPREVPIVRSEIAERYRKADPEPPSSGAGGSGGAPSANRAGLSDQTLHDYCQRREFRRVLQAEATLGKSNLGGEFN